MEKYSVEAILSAVDKGFSSTIDKIGNKLGGLQKHSSKTSDSFGRTFGAMAAANVATGVLSRVTGSLGSLKDEAIIASDAADKFKSTMQFAGFDNGAIESATRAAKKYADDTVYDMKTIYNTTAQLAANGVKDYTGLTQAAGNLNAVAGGNAETFKSVAMMLTQTAGAGKLTTENWNQLADAIPGASGLLQKAMKENGAYTGDFREAMAKGQITAEEFNEAIMQLGFSEAAQEAATSSKTIEGAFGQMQAAVVNGLTAFIDAIGKDTITDIVNSFTELIEKGFKKLIEILPSVISFVKDALNTFKDWAPVIVAVATALGTLKVLSTISDSGGFLTFVMQAVKGTKLWAAAQGMLDLVMTANPIGLIIAAIAALVAVIVYLWNTNEDFRNAVINAWEAIKEKVNAVIAYLTALWEVFKSTASAVWQAIIDAIVAVWEYLKTTAMTVWQAIVDTITAVLEPYIAIFSAIWEGMKQALYVIWESIKALVNVAIEAVKGIIDGVMQILSGDWEGGWNTIKETLNTAWERMKAIVTNLINAIWNIIKGVWNSIYNTISSILSSISSTVSSIWNSIVGLVSRAVNNIYESAKRAWENLKTATSSAIDSVKNFFNRLWDIDLFAAGKAILEGFLNGLKSVWGSVKSFVGDIAGWIANNKGPISYDRRLLIPAGKAIMGGFNTSLMDSFKDVQQNIKGITGSIQSQFNVKTSHEFGNIKHSNQPLEMHFTLGGRDYRAFVNDISETQNKVEKIRLKTV